jgi:multiple sugar transport system permease protein
VSRFDNKKTGIINSLDFKRIRVRILYYSMLAGMLAVSFICLAPPLWVFISSFKDVKEIFQVPPTIIPHSFDLEKLSVVFVKFKFAKFMLNSLYLIIGSVICSIVFPGLLGYVISRLKPVGSKLVFMLILWSMMLPSSMSMVPLFKNIVALKMMNSFLPLWLMTGANAFAVLMFKTFFDSIPMSYIEAAKIDGATNLGIFARIVLPMSKGIVTVFSIMAANGAWSEFFWSFMILKKQEMFTVMVRMFTLSSATSNISLDIRLVMISMSVLPPALVFIFLQKQIMNGISFSGVKG